MAQPPSYKRKHDFTKDEKDDLNLQAFNDELDGASESIEGIRENLALIQKDDGTLANNIVGMDQLENNVIEAFEKATEDSAKQAAESASAAAKAARQAAESSDATQKAASSAQENAKAAEKNALQTSDNRTEISKMLVQMQPAIDNVGDIVIVAKNIGDVTIVAKDIDSVVAVASIKDEVVEVHENSANIRTVAAADSQVRTVSANVDDVKTVAGDLESSLPTGAVISYGDITKPLQETQQTTGGAIKTCADNIEHVRQAASNANRAEDAMEDAQESAEESSSSQKLARRWAVEETTPIEGGLYGAKYYAEAAARSSKAAGDSATTAGNAQKATVEAAKGASQSAIDAGESANAAGTAARAAADSATSAGTSATNAGNYARDAAKNATAAGKSASAAAGSAQEASKSQTAAETAKGDAESAAERAEKAAEDATAGQVNPDWNETNPEKKSCILHKPDAFPPASHEHQIDDVEGLRTELDKLAQNSAGADSVLLAQQIVGFYNGLTGSTVDYREYVDMPPSDLLTMLYSFGVGYEAEVTQ